MEWSKKQYNAQYENWVPWIEDKYRAWFGTDNKASYAIKDTLGQSKVTGNEQVDKAQDGVNHLAGGQIGKCGLLQPVGDMASKEGVNRMERGGKDDKGSYGGAAGGYTDPMINKSKDAEQSIQSGASNTAGGVSGAIKGAGGYVSSLGVGVRKRSQRTRGW